MNLSKFCANETDPREYLRTPSRHGDNVLATNGHILIVVPGLAGDYPKVNKAIAASVDRLLVGSCSGELVLLSSIALPEREVCEVCNGKGVFFFRPCPDCQGAGDFMHGSHWYTCKECDGDGEVSCKETDEDAKKCACPRCYGMGEHYKPVAINDALFQRPYLALLAELPGCAIQTNGPEGGAKFTFEGGHGVLMPCRAS